MKALPVVRVSIVIRTKLTPGCNDEVAGFLQTHGNAEGLHRAEDDSQIARPLGDFLAAEFAFFLQFRQRLINHRQQLQNDGGRDVRHDAQSEDGQPAKLAAANQIDEAQERSAVLFEELLQTVGIDSGRGDVAAEPVNAPAGQA